MNNRSDDTLTSQDLEVSLDVGNLLYLEEKSSNVVVERTIKVQYSDSPEYSENSEIVVNFQTGSDYISSKDSFMKLTLGAIYGSDGTTPATGLVNFGTNGSILNCFKTIRILSRSGTVIAQTDSANLLNFYKVNYQHSQQWKSQQGLALLGLNDTSNYINGGKEFLIPLQLISSFFETQELLPSQLCRSMRIEISVETAEVAFVHSGSVTTLPAKYTLEGVQVHLDSYSLTSAAVNWLNNRSAKEGLVMTYHDWENSQFSKAIGQTSYSYEVRKTASMSNSLMTIFRNKRASEVAENSFASAELLATDTYQYRVGSLYLPVQPVQGKLQMYNQQNYAMDKLRSGHELGVTLTQFNALGVLPAVLDRYWLNNSGLALNNSTTASISGVNDGTKAKDVDIFLKHTRSLLVFLQQVRRSD